MLLGMLGSVGCETTLQFNLAFIEFRGGVLHVLDKEEVISFVVAGVEVQQIAKQMPSSIVASYF